MDTEKYRNLLVERRKEILAERDGATESLSRSREDGADMEEDAVLEANQLGKGVLSQRLAHELNEIERALRRIDEGTFGQCGNCDAAIPEKRLEAIPWTTHCPHCGGEPPEDDAERLTIGEGRSVPKGLKPTPPPPDEADKQATLYGEPPNEDVQETIDENEPLSPPDSFRDES
jgi:DnaK suppressor protein